MEIDQRFVEEYKAQAEYIAETIARDERALEHLNGRAREHVYWRIRWRRRELEVMRRRLGQMEEDLFPRDVLRDLENL